MSRAYVYTIAVDGLVRYVGKGTGRRLNDHLRLAKAYLRRRAAGEMVVATYLQRRLASAWTKGQDIEATILFGGLTDEEAFDIEAETIELAPVGQLWNLAPGGEGMTSERAKALHADPEYRAKLARFLADPEFRAARGRAISAALKRRFAQQPEESERMARQQREAWKKPGAREARSARMSADQRKADGPKARIIAAIGPRGATLDQICAQI